MTLRVVEVAHRTDTGRQREANEDSYIERSPLFAVADGMGGAQAGEVASNLAVSTFEVEPGEEASPEEFLRQQIERANGAIFDRARGDKSRSGMGTTLTAALVRAEEVSLGHVGDSRAYLLRDGELEQLTQDHSLVEELRRQGKLTKEQAADHPQRSVITRALGPEPVVEVDTMTIRGRAGDVFLLCSDGLTTMVTDQRIASIIASASSLKRAADHLVRVANDRGGKDNITVVLFRLGDDGDSAPVADEAATLIGTSATEQGLDAASVERAVEEDRRRKAEPAGTGRPAVPSSRRSAGRRALRLLGAAAAVVLVAGAAWLGARQVWFVGLDEGGRVSLFRGLPYELPLGLELYSEQLSSPITLEALPEERRAVVTDHELRSKDDAVSLIADLQRSADELAASEAEDRRDGGTRPRDRSE